MGPSIQAITSTRFGLLFFKRLCDVWEEEYEQRLAQYHNAEIAADPEEHRFDIPQEHSWGEIRNHTTSIGERLNIAFAEIENRNSKLAGIFQGTPGVPLKVTTPA